METRILAAFKTYIYEINSWMPLQCHNYEYKPLLSESMNLSFIIMSFTPYASFTLSGSEKQENWPTNQLYSNQNRLNVHHVIIMIYKPINRNSHLTWRQQIFQRYPRASVHMGEKQWRNSSSGSARWRARQERKQKHSRLVHVAQAHC